jgi:hypothetical protein
MENQTARSKDIQFQTRGAAFDTLEGSKVGRIIDMNKDGLSFHYLREAFQREDDARQKCKVSIFHQDGFTLHGVPCRVVKENSVLSEYSFNLLTIGRCDIHFGATTAEQESKLDYFISNFIGNDT